ncbi:MAG: primosomal protein N', partial [Phycisphaerae bacterium]
MSRRRRQTGAPLLESPELRRGLVVDVAPAAPIDRVYSYTVPDELADRAVPGVRVRVPFGRGGRTAEAYVIARSERDWDSTLRTIAEVLDDRPLVSPELLELALWMAHYYACPLGPTLSAAAPSASRSTAGFHNVRYVRLSRAVGVEEKLPPKKRAVVEVLTAREETPKRRNTETPKHRHVCSPTSRERKRPVMAGSGERGAGNEYSGAPHSSDGSVQRLELSIDDLCARAGCTPAVIRALEKAGIVEIVRRRERRDTAIEHKTPAEPDFALNPEQYAAAQRVIEAVVADAFRVFVLFGVTGSGKTEVYIHAMRHAIAEGKQTILLVPEIALTTQTVQRLSKRFARVAVIHSGLTASNRTRAWAAIAAGEIDVVIGTRSAVFAPCRRLGLIVVDEEQETSYKNLAAPRYHTRDVAIKRAQLEKTPIVLGSATPSLETWHNAARFDHYELLRLPRRVAGLSAPRLHLVDMRTEHRARRGVHLLSREMEHYLSGTLERGEQAVLLLNRRGYANYLFCPKCGTPVVCPNCGVYVVFHQATQLAHCHYCRCRIAVPRRCAMAGCGGTLVRFGMGTERVEAEMREKYPNARTARMDSDVMARPRDYADVLSRFERREIDVLVGTQMIAKGLDYPFVSFVGVVSADTALAIDDFRADERTFQLIVQVAGRSGRSDVGGDVVVQSFKADMRSVRLAMQQDFERFAKSELEQRRKTGVPPITRMVRIVLADPRLSRARQAAEQLVVSFRERLFTAGLNATVDDARACALPRLRNQYRFEVLLTFNAPRAMLAALDRLRADGVLKA